MAKSGLLNITNGDAALRVMREARLPGDFFAWQDVLHEGPVPQGLDLEALSAVRADFLAGCGWDRSGRAREVFEARDARLAAAASYDQVRLWFEHDLYDQLQLLQILDWWAAHGTVATRLTLICSDRYLGPSTVAEIVALLALEREVSTAELQLARRAWSAFRSGTPEAWAALLREDLSALPFLAGAVTRLLEEYPSPVSGLSRTERVALELVRAEPSRPARLFDRYQRSEARRFLGDIVFAARLQAFLDADEPLLELDAADGLAWPGSAPGPRLSLSEAGGQVLDGVRNWLEIAPPDRWIGGVHLTADDLWYWDAKRSQLEGGAVNRKDGR